MSQPDQWRFQWPDGTWIRWNPHTQTWEKEPPGAEGAADAREPEPEAPEQEPGSPDPTPAPEAEPSGPPELAEAERPARSERVGAESVRKRSPRPMVDDVLPPRSAGEQPAASLWPTVLTGIIVGLGVGLFLWNMIR